MSNEDIKKDTQLKETCDCKRNLEELTARIAELEDIVTYYYRVCDCNGGSESCEACNKVKALSKSRPMNIQCPSVFGEIKSRPCEHEWERILDEGCPVHGIELDPSKNGFACSCRMKKKLKSRPEGGKQ